MYSFIYFSSSLLHKGFLYLFFLYLFFIFIAAKRLSLVAVNGGCSLVEVHWLLTAVVSLVAENGLQGAQASVVVAPGLSCSMACRILPEEESNGVSCIGGWILYH